MKKRINIIFSHFDYPKTLSVNDIVNVFKTLPYNEDIGFGYTDVEINSGIIYATLTLIPQHYYKIFFLST